MSISSETVFISFRFKAIHNVIYVVVSAERSLPTRWGYGRKSCAALSEKRKSPANP
jgi:hypothetical protein